jgi:hypothetical protein
LLEKVETGRMDINQHFARFDFGRRDIRRSVRQQIFD